MKLQYMVLILCICLQRCDSTDRSKRSASTMVSEAIATAKQYLTDVKASRASYLTSGADVVPQSGYGLASIKNNYEQQETKDKYDETTICVKVTKVLSEQLGSYDNVMANQQVVSEFDSQIIPDCTPPPNPDCYAYPHATYRSYDGTCNNIYKPYLGASFTAQSRYLEPAYNDGIDEPRKKSVLGDDLPSPRKVSNLLFKLPRNKLNFKGRSMVMSMFGQFLDHDIVHTPTMSGPDGQRPMCCPDDVPRVECFPFFVPADDERFEPLSCRHFARSSPTFAEPCKFGRRQQINQNTHYLDLSMVYGSTAELASELRSHVDGKLRTRAGDLPPSGGFCVDECCILAGDVRANEIPPLTILHVLFLREHNRIATELAAMNPSWINNDEKLFQETRRILIAIWQKIVYEEFVPKFMNADFRTQYNLEPGKPPYRSTYDSSKDPSIRNIFSTAVYRMGHSLVSETVGKSDCDGNILDEVPLFEKYFKPCYALEDGTESLKNATYYLTSNIVALTDGQLSDSVRDQLFRDPSGNALDLGSLNIQRGRDHGLPSYNTWREFVGLTPPQDFTDSPQGLADQVPFYRPKLQNTYSVTADIDIYIGGLSERGIPNGELGPTFSHIFGMQFRDLKFGDRFFYEHGDPKTGFTDAQLRAIKRYTLAKMMCENFEMPKLQPDVFSVPSDCNPLVDCSELPDLLLKQWKETVNHIEL